MLVTRLPAFRFDDAALGALPADVRAAGLRLADDVDTAPAIADEPFDWV